MDYSKFEQLSSLSDEEFQALMDEYNFSKMSMLPVPEQKAIREQLKKEADRRVILSSHYDVGRENLVEKINIINEKLSLLEKVTGGNYDSFPGISQDVATLKAQLEELTKKLALVDKKIELNENKIGSVTGVAKKTKFSIIKRGLDVGKKTVFVTAPQKICDLGKGILARIKKNINKVSKKSLELSEKTEEKFENYYEKNDKSLAAIDDAMESLMQGLQQTDEMRGYEKYVVQNDIQQDLQRKKRRYERIVKKDNIVCKLQPGVVNMIKMPATLINKLSNRQGVITQQTSMGM